MPDRDFFLDLQQYGEKLYPFVQRDAYGHMHEANFGAQYRFASGGACAAVTVDWLHEKLWKPAEADQRNFTHTRSLMDRLLDRPLPPAAAVQERNTNTQFTAAWDQVHYTQQVQNYGSSTRAMDDLLRLRGLEHSGQHTPGAPGGYLFVSTRPGDPEQNSRYRVVESMTRATTPQNLANGQGVMIIVGVDANESHSVAFYRSNGNRLYFFDPNTGVYQVNPTKVPEFVNEWKIGAEKRWEQKLNFEPRRPGHGAYYVNRDANLQQRPTQRLRPHLALAPQIPYVPPPTASAPPSHPHSVAEFRDNNSSRHSYESHHSNSSHRSNPTGPVTTTTPTQSPSSSRRRS